MKEHAESATHEQTIEQQIKPLLYSPKAIVGFSVFFTVIFGAVLLALNLEKRKDRWLVIGFGIAYTTAVIIIMNVLPRANTGLTLGFNWGGALVLTKIFWNKYVGKETIFVAKPIWKPLIISIIITIPFILAAIFSR